MSDIPEATIETLYLDLLKRVLTRTGVDETYYRPLDWSQGAARRAVYPLVRRALAPWRVHIVREISSTARAEGRDWPADAETMMGVARLDNLHDCIVDVIRNGVPGDLLETGVWRGGATIFMRAVLKAYGDTLRSVWVADSFQGLPKPDVERYPQDAADRFWTADPLAVSLSQVRANFKRYGLLDERVHFLEGWFRDTLPSAPVERLAVLRLDGDMFESTDIALRSLYDKVSPGGYVIVDDYGAVAGCRAAVDAFRKERGLTEKLEQIDWTGVYWQRSSDAAADLSRNDSSSRTA